MKSRIILLAIVFIVSAFVITVSTSSYVQAKSFYGDCTSNSQCGTCGSGVCGGYYFCSSNQQCTTTCVGPSGNVCSTGACTLSSGTCGTGSQSQILCNGHGSCSTVGSSVSCTVSCPSGYTCSSGQCVSSTSTISVSTISVSASPTSVPADGSSTASITATTSGYNVLVSFTTTLGTLSPTSCYTTYPSGSQYACAVSIKSSTAGTATVTASASGYNSGSTSVTFTQWYSTTLTVAFDGASCPTGDFCASGSLTTSSGGVGGASIGLSGTYIVYPSTTFTLSTATATTNGAGNYFYDWGQLNQCGYSIKANYAGNSTYSSSSASTNLPCAYSAWAATFSQTGIPSGITWGVTITNSSGSFTYTSSSTSLQFVTAGNSFTYQYFSPVFGTTGVRYACTSGCSGTYYSTSSSATAGYTRQYQMCMAVSPSGSGTTSPTPAGYCDWWNSGSNVGISATASTGYLFNYWSSDASITIANPNAGTGTSSSSTTATVNGYGTVTANFKGGPCTSNSLLPAGQCCDRDPSIPPSDQGPGNAYYAGQIYDSKYLCDPPGWSTVSQQLKNNFNLFSWMFFPWQNLPSS